MIRDEALFTLSCSVGRIGYEILVIVKQNEVPSELQPFGVARPGPRIQGLNGGRSRRESAMLRWPNECDPSVIRGRVYGQYSKSLFWLAWVVQVQGLGRGSMIEEICAELEIDLFEDWKFREDVLCGSIKIWVSREREPGRRVARKEGWQVMNRVATRSRS